MAALRKPGLGRIPKPGWNDRLVLSGIADALVDDLAVERTFGWMIRWRRLVRN
jgi:hypothetical protein